MRTQKAIKNATLSLFNFLLWTIVKFLTRSVFVFYLGKEKLGLNGLFLNIVSVLSLFELGIGTALNFALYKPLNENDCQKTANLVYLYKRIFSVFVVVLVAASLAITPFLQHFIKEYTLPINEIRLYFLLFVLASAATYLNAHRVSLMNADQAMYIQKSVSTAFAIACSLLQCLAVYFTKSFYAFIIIMIVSNAAQNFVLATVVKKRYPWLNEIKPAKLSDNDRTDIVTKVKGIFFHKIGESIVYNTDSIFISLLIGITTVGIYSNYVLILGTLSTIAGTLFFSMTATVGNLLLNCENDNSAKKSVFDAMFLINVATIMVACTGVYVLANPFISLWLGAEYTFSKSVLAAIVFSFMVSTSLNTVTVFKEAKGIFYIDRYKPIAEAATKIILSLLLARAFGLAGIFLGAAISKLLTEFFISPYVTLKYCFGVKPYRYYAKHFFALVLCAAVGVTADMLLRPLPDTILFLLIKGAAAVAFALIVFTAVYFKTPAFKDLINRMKAVFKKYFKKA